MKLEIRLLRNTLLQVQQLDFKCGECEDEFNTARGSEIKLKLATVVISG